MLAVMFPSSMDRLTRAYPLIYLACHRRHLQGDERGRRVTEQQQNILQHLDSEKPRSMGELSRHLDVTDGTMSLHLTRLEAAGYVRREVDAKDHRRRAVRLTPRGARLKREHSIFDLELTRRLIALVPAAEIESALRGLEILAQAAEKLLLRRKSAAQGRR